MNHPFCIERPYFPINIAKREGMCELDSSPAQFATLSTVGFDSLMTLTKSTGRVWNRTQLLNQVWGLTISVTSTPSISTLRASAKSSAWMSIDLSSSATFPW